MKPGNLESKRGSLDFPSYSVTRLQVSCSLSYDRQNKITEPNSIHLKQPQWGLFSFYSRVFSNVFTNFLSDQFNGGNDIHLRRLLVSIHLAAAEHNLERFWVSTRVRAVPPPPHPLPTCPWPCAPQADSRAEGVQTSWIMAGNIWKEVRVKRGHFQPAAGGPWRSSRSWRRRGSLENGTPASWASEIFICQYLLFFKSF